jgi:hypothetical protein
MFPGRKETRRLGVHGEHDVKSCVYCILRLICRHKSFLLSATGSLGRSFMSVLWALKEATLSSRRLGHAIAHSVGNIVQHVVVPEQNECFAGARCRVTGLI